MCAPDAAAPVLANIREAELDAAGKKYLDIYRQWNCRNDAGSKGSTVFERWWHAFEGLVYDDDYAKAPKGSMRPFLSTLVEAILKDSAYKFLDNVNTPQTETLADDITAAFKAATAELQSWKPKERA